MMVSAYLEVLYNLLIVELTVQQCVRPKTKCIKRDLFELLVILFRECIAQYGVLLPQYRLTV